MVDRAQAIDLTTRMHSMRESMRFIWGEQYQEKVAPWETTITQVAEGEHVKPLQAAVRLALVAKDNSLVVMAVMAAYVELTERGNDQHPRDIVA